MKEYLKFLSQIPKNGYLEDNNIVPLMFLQLQRVRYQSQILFQKIYEIQIPLCLFIFYRAMIAY
jgi:hypothetical protein